MAEVSYSVPKKEFNDLARLLYEALHPIVVYTGMESDHKAKALEYIFGRLDSALEILIERDKEAVYDVIREIQEKRR